ncbi:hypothetical protein X798_00308 [Onchocerca flexuosa]|uniref:Uncharacterized protein n=1 Tax=Onchocerca flexuosa TaxID=387005 RepID=A0A238C5Y0_9BILA|nr:hypothetical protein X798_00308 [Onchocerca flexuosa]
MYKYEVISQPISKSQRKQMPSTGEKSIPTVSEKLSISDGNRNVHSLEISLMFCSLLGMTGFCTLCAIFFTYSGTFILHICLALIGGIAVLIGVLTHFPTALLLYMIIQVASTIYLSIVAILSISIFSSPNKWKFDETRILGHTNDVKETQKVKLKTIFAEIRKSGIILMFFSFLLIPISVCSMAAAIQLFHRCGEEKMRNEEKNKFNDSYLAI